MDAVVASFWVEAAERLAARVTHELKNPLNAAVINLEVVRTRAARQGTDPGALVPYAEAAAGALERAVLLTEALLALARPVPAPVDLSAMVPPLAELYRALVAPDGGTVDIALPAVGGALVDADGDAVRLGLVTALDSAVATPGEVRGGLERSGNGWTVRLETRGEPGPIAPPVRDALSPLGIEITAERRAVRVNVTGRG
ncbi:MAG TPA: histidine kinase dimerization/phospho-acceptor domain-containing protein [Gemmatimonadaceae bacterium]|nr:histidine kinase dimerization/phospho-acceptor domain-containing protein [Gemmatimonadaceae bacterium]